MGGHGFQLRATVTGRLTLSHFGTLGCNFVRPGGGSLLPSYRFHPALGFWKDIGDLGWFPPDGSQRYVQDLSVQEIYTLDATLP
jgi:hypothetical protein